MYSVDIPEGGGAAMNSQPSLHSCHSTLQNVHAFCPADTAAAFTCLIISHTATTTIASMSIRMTTPHYFKYCYLCYYDDY